MHRRTKSTNGRGARSSCVRGFKFSTAATALAASGLAFAVGPAAGQDVRPLLVVDHVAASEWLPDAHDERLVSALSMLPDRIAELPGEIPGLEPEIAGVIELLVRTAARPGRFSLTYNPNNPTGFFGYGLVVSTETGGRGEANALHAQAVRVMQQAGDRVQPRPSELFNGFTEIPTPGGSVHFGAREDAGVWRYEIIAGSVDDPAAGFDAFADLADGAFDPVVRGRLDLTSLTAAVNTAQMMAGEEGQQFTPIRRLLERAGLIGPNAMNFDYSVGHSKDALMGRLRAQRAQRFFEFLRLPTDTIPAGHFATMPADSYYATMARLDLGFIEALLDLAAEFGAPVSDMEAQFRGELDMDLREDLLRPLGGSVGYYMSESTGGGGLTSLVVLSTFKDRERFLASHAKLVELSNELRGQMGAFGRYIRLEAWEHMGVSMMSLRFPGVPVPLEISYAVTDEWLVVSPTPQGAIAGAMQAIGRGDEGLLSNPRFKGKLPVDKGLQSFQIVDTHHTIRNGYPTAQFLGSAIANMVRSPVGAPREPGVIVPTFNELRKGIEASWQYSVWDGEDLWTHAGGDRSALAVLAGQAGAFGGGGFGGSLAPALLGMMEGGGPAGPLFMTDPPEGPTFAGLALDGALAGVPAPYAAAAIILSAEAARERAAGQGVR